MPEIKLKHVVSCSSEDNTHKAENLLSSDTYRKWKAGKAGETQTSVILQLEKEEQLHSIDIGNEGSAFIEVLVGRSTSVKDQDFEVLLVTSSFMSPSESKNGTNTNRVRFFGPNQLQKTAAQENWDRVKIVCSQPYNKSIAYGVAFVKFHSPPDKGEAATKTPPKLTKLGQFRVKDEPSSAGPSLQPGSLFFNRENTSKTSPTLKVSPQNVKLSYASAALQAGGGSGSPLLSAQPLSSPSPTQAPVKRKFEFSKERQSAPAVSSSKKASLVNSPEESPSSLKPKARPNTASSHRPSTAKEETPDKKRDNLKSETKPKPAKDKTQDSKQVPFNRIMEGVVFVLSGFQNPFRAELRDKALAMGAKYRPDWTADASHLICAFANTPKYSQVKSAGGMIVRKEWVLDCHKKKQKIPYKRYLMDGSESSSEDEVEEDDEKMKEKERKTPQKQERQVTPQKPQIKNEDMFGSSTDADEPEDMDESGMDTEDELKRVESVRRKKKVEERKKGEERKKDVKDEDLYGGSTDENTDAEAEENKPIPELPDFLTGKRFFLYGTFPNNVRRLLLRYIIAFNGAVEDYMSDKVQFVVTSSGWHNSFEDALMENGNLSFVKPAWIFSINDRQKLLPYQPFTVVP
ncbi:DNA repair protein XRCC1 isoform X1 [Hypomesus transpacificus]|uniref:DNA repair protein XRCC1 isoform X1 n=1 Tax=Hypomesus transpacificus TaxID=137520 RepID=UPI001F086AC7|nr:DNA repair protein XRCC1 isoform X1 [Hypomesus transpacificus]